MKDPPQWILTAAGCFLPVQFVTVARYQGPMNENAPHPCGAGTSHAACSGCIQVAMALGYFLT